MKKYNVTAQVYSKFDDNKQTILMNEIVSATSEQDAIQSFKDIYEIDHAIVQIYSVVNF